MGAHAGSRQAHPLPCAQRVRLRRLVGAGDPEEPSVPLLQDIARDITACCGHSLFKAHRLAWGWTAEQAVTAFHLMCADNKLKARGLTTRSWLEWEAGACPNRDYTELLSRLFSTSVVGLGFAGDYTPAETIPPLWTGAATVPIPSRATHADDVGRHIVAGEARYAAHFARKITSSAMNDITLEQIDADVRQLAREYVSQPLVNLFVDIRELRTDVFGLLECNRYPEQMRQLYSAASRLCGLQAHICLDLGYYPEADTQTRTAWLCADLAGQPVMQSWVRGVQSLIAYWDARHTDARQLAEDGTRYATNGSIAVRLPALAARACAALGDGAGALAALDAADQARERLSTDDETGGVFTFPDAKQAAYTGTTLLTLNDPRWVPRAVQASTDAIARYQGAVALDRSSGDILAARLDLATAHLSGGDLDGCHQELSTVLTTPEPRRTASIRKRAVQLGHQLTDPRYARSPLACQMRESIISFCALPPALPAEAAAGSPET